MYQLNMTVKDEHIDFQGIVDGLYYPFYFEECRHKFLQEVIGIDIAAYSKEGFNLVLVEYTLKFKKSLHKDDQFIVTCRLKGLSRSTFVAEQEILCNDKVAAIGTFTATCVPSAGGRLFIPEKIKQSMRAMESEARVSIPR